MSRPIETSLTMSCLMCDWFAEVRNSSTGMSASFVTEAKSHVTQHEQHAVELIQRVKVYSAGCTCSPGRTSCCCPARQGNAVRLPGQGTSSEPLITIQPGGADNDRILLEMPGAPGDAAGRGSDTEERAGGDPWQVR